MIMMKNFYKKTEMDKHVTFKTGYEKWEKYDRKGRVICSMNRDYVVTLFMHLFGKEYTKAFWLRREYFESPEDIKIWSKKMKKRAKREFKDFKVICQLSAEQVDREFSFSRNVYGYKYAVMYYYEPCKVKWESIKD